MKLNGLGANHLTLGGEGGGEGGGGGVSLKKISCKGLSEEKNCMEHKCNRKLIGKKGKKYPAHQIASKKKFLMTKNHPPPPPPAQELNGRPLRLFIKSGARSHLILVVWHGC